MVLFGQAGCIRHHSMCTGTCSLVVVVAMRGLQTVPAGGTMQHNELPACTLLCLLGTGVKVVQAQWRK
jgi:hypothetical protein